MNVPKYRKHSSGQARVTIAGRDYLLGQYGSRDSKREYNRVIAEYLASNRSISFGKPSDELKFTELVADYVSYAKEYYGTAPDSELFKLKHALKSARALYGRTPAIEFGPLQYKAVRAHLMKEGDRSRSYINSMMMRIRRMFSWAVSEGKLPGTVVHALKSVEPLKKGRTELREAEDIKPVPIELVESTLPLLNTVVKAMVQFQMLTGCRPGEVCSIKPAMVDRSGEVWEIRLDQHKTAHRGKKRIIYAGPKAQEVLRPFLLRGAEEYCFSPKEAERKRRVERFEARTTPLNEGNKPGSNRKRKPARQPGECYTTSSYHRSIRYACQKSKLDEWSPNQLRHSAATRIRKEFGLEAAQVTLGHSELGVTQVYAEADRSKAIEVARRIG